MTTAAQSRQALRLLTGTAVTASWRVLHSLTGTPEARRADLLDAVPAIIGHYSDGSSALAADFYDDERERAAARGRYTAAPVVADRVVKIRRGIAWSTEPLFDDALNATVESRLAEVVQFETARPYRDTITTNRQRDPEAVGWRRVTSGGCKFCLMLADKGAIFREDTARFASHPNCHCGAQPVFRSNDTGETASVMQYVASSRNRTPAQKAALREYLNEHFPDVHG